MDGRTGPRGSSDRTFGLVFFAFFVLLGAFPLVRGEPPRAGLLLAAGAFLAVAMVRPALLAPLNRLWTRFGLLLHKLVSPVALGILFYGVVAPTGLLMRLFGKDPLRLRRDPAAASYWIERAPPGPPPESLKNQF